MKSVLRAFLLLPALILALVSNSIGRLFCGGWFVRLD